MATPTAPPNKLLPFIAAICFLLVIAAMYLMHLVLVPVVLAALLAFVLTLRYLEFKDEGKLCKYRHRRANIG